MIIKFVQGFTKRGGWWVVAQAVLFAVILVALTHNEDPVSALRVLGWVLVAGALVLGGSGLWMIRDKLTAMPAPVDGAVLLERGPFALVRHPIYGAIILGFVGLSIKGGNLEEQLLALRFPEYSTYRSRVRYRVLPWIF